VVVQHRPEGIPFEGVELHYFCLRGLGELPRLMLEVTRTAYDSVMYFDTKEYKDIGPFGQMPLLKDPPNLGGGMGTGGWLPQSSSIVRHIARINSLDAGPDDPVLQVCPCICDTHPLAGLPAHSL
jgi:glutathione S-transferase